MLETFVKVFLATKMKCAVVSALISIAFVSQAFAVLRPLFPAKPAPPFNGELIIIGDDSVMGYARKRLHLTMPCKQRTFTKSARAKIIAALI